MHAHSADEGVGQRHDPTHVHMVGRSCALAEVGLDLQHKHGRRGQDQHGSSQAWAAGVGSWCRDGVEMGPAELEFLL